MTFTIKNQTKIRYKTSVYAYFWNHLGNLHSTKHANSKPPLPLVSFMKVINGNKRKNNYLISNRMTLQKVNFIKLDDRKEQKKVRSFCFPSFLHARTKEYISLSTEILLAYASCLMSNSFELILLSSNTWNKT